MVDGSIGVFFFNDTATTEIYTLSLHDALPIVARVRELGWSIALDDVGADPMSLAFMPLLRPDVVKLDLRLVQDEPGPAIAEIMNAVNAYAERSGARVLAEGIENDHHLRMAKALGATLGQGWLF